MYKNATLAGESSPPRRQRFHLPLGSCTETIADVVIKAEHHLLHTKRSWRSVLAGLLLGAFVAGACQRPPATNATGAGAPAERVALPVAGDAKLRSPDAFMYEDEAERSRALFVEASRVMLHPRCVNCHPSGDVPLQHAGRLHDPPVLRGPEDKGVVGMECTSCHQDGNLELSRVPGAPGWHLAPPSMAWVGKSPGALCEQLKDRARNGNKTLEQIVEHSGHDALVAWGWAPGGDREPAPGSQVEFGALMAAWAETGAECPPEHTEQTEQP